MKLPFNRPTLPPYDLFKKRVESFYDTGMITNGQVVRQLESDVRETMRVDNAVAISSCTSGLMLALKCLGATGKVALPSFSFFASAHAVLWNGLEPVFVDVDSETWNISLEALERALDADVEISTVMPVHIFGNPCDVNGLEALAHDRGLYLVFDSAHAMGAKVVDRWVGCFGDVEVFSLSPTKLVVAGEGGMLTTGNGELASMLRAGRDYGNDGDYNPSFCGLNARMSEFHASLAIESFNMLEENVRRRNMIADRYKEGLSNLDGISFQVIETGHRSTYKDLTILIDEERFGVGRDALAWYLYREGIDTRKYYDPPVHRTVAYWERWGRNCDESLPVTNRISKRVLSLPIWSHMELEIVDRVVEAIGSAQKRAEKIGRDYLSK